MNTTYDTFRDAWVEVDSTALLHNFQEVRRAVGPNVKICAVLKAQCYGLGGAQAAEVLKDADCYAVRHWRCGLLRRTRKFWYWAMFHPMALPKRFGTTSH